MSILPILGPYQFATADENLNCGCGGLYCTPFINNDVIAFQIPSSQSCCEELAGCSQLTDECVTSQTLTSDLTYTQAGFNISFNAAAFVANDWILKGNASFAANTKYIIRFNFREHTSFTTVQAQIGPTQSSITITGNGDFQLVVDPALGAPTSLDWGIIVTGGDTVLTAVLESLSVCVYREFTAALYDSDGANVASITRQEGATGNQIFDFPVNIPAEIPTGCYEVRITEDCDDTVYISQCLTFLSGVSCAPPNSTLQFKWRNRNDAFGFDYTTDATYYNYVRVVGRLKHPTFPDDTEISTFSNNTNAVINARVQKLWKVALNDLPEYVHSTISTMRRHSDLQIDGVPFVVADGSYSPEWRKSSDLATSEFEAFDQSFDGVSTNC